jgi:hypothetical protein
LVRPDAIGASAQTIPESDQDHGRVSTTVEVIRGGGSQRFCSRLLRALFQFSKRAAGEATKFGRSGVKLLGVVGAARFECGEATGEAGELIRRQLGDNFGNFFDFHVAQYSTAEAWLSDGKVARSLGSIRHKNTRT